MHTGTDLDLDLDLLDFDAEPLHHLRLGEHGVAVGRRVPSRHGARTSLEAVISQRTFAQG